jgi:hypothetical protein
MKDQQPGQVVGISFKSRSGLATFPKAFYEDLDFLVSNDTQSEFFTASAIREGFGIGTPKPIYLGVWDWANYRNRTPESLVQQARRLGYAGLWPVIRPYHTSEPNWKVLAQYKTAVTEKTQLR